MTKKRMSEDEETAKSSKIETKNPLPQGAAVSWKVAADSRIMARSREKHRRGIQHQRFARPGREQNDTTADIGRILK